MEPARETSVRNVLTSGQSFAGDGPGGGWACELAAFQAWETREARRKQTKVTGRAIAQAEGSVRADLSDDKSSQLGETAGDAVAWRPRQPHCIILSCSTPPKKMPTTPADSRYGCDLCGVHVDWRVHCPLLPQTGSAILKVYLTEEPGPKSQCES